MMLDGKKTLLRHVLVIRRYTHAQRRCINTVLIRLLPLLAVWVVFYPALPICAQEKTVVNSLGMEFVLIPAGMSVMGSSIEEADRGVSEVRHPVTISQPFYMQTTEVTVDQWRDVIETNLGGTFNYCHAVTQPMMMARSGSIVNLSSTAAEFAARGQVNYAASKGGIDSLTRALAKELAPRNVRVNAIAPGMIETDMTEAVRGLAGDQITKAIPLKRIGTPEEIAHVVVFLAGDRSSYLTGQVLRVDGGLSLGGY